MKKLFGTLLTAFVMLFGGLFLTACGEERASFLASFKTAEFTIQMGEEYDPFEYVQEEFSEEQKSQMDFKTDNPSVAYVSADKKLSAVNYGSTVLYVLVDNVSVASCQIYVPAPPIQLGTPPNLRFNDQTGALEWNKVFYTLSGAEQFVPNYLLELKKGEGEFVSHRIVEGYQFVIQESGTYTARVKAERPSTAFADTQFSDDYTFEIMAAPTNLVFNMDTKTLTWNANGNPAGTRYRIKYTFGTQSEQSVETTQTTCAFAQNIGAGNHSLRIETISPSVYTFANQSQILQITKLATVNNVEFDNGEVTWQPVAGASEYLVKVYNGSTLLGSETVQGASSILPKTLAVAAGAEYYVTGQALGGQTNIFSGDPSDAYCFEKLPDAVLKFNAQDNKFSITNKDLGAAELVVIEGQTQTLITSFPYNWGAINRLNPNSFAAQIKATNPYEQIDGNVVTTFTVEGVEGSFTTLRNSSNFSVEYREANNNAEIVCDSPVEGGNLVLKQDGVELTGLTINGNVITVDSLETFFTGGTKTHNFELQVSKPAANDTYFVPVKKSFRVAQITAPELIKLNDNNGNVVVETVKEFTEFEGAAGVEFIVNDEITNVLDMDEDDWIIQARYIAQTLPSELTNGSESITRYYASSPKTTYQITRLASVENVVVNYATKKISYSAVANAVEYKVFYNNQEVKSTSNLEFDFDDLSGEVEIVAYRQALDQISRSTTISPISAYFQSKPVVVSIDKVADIEAISLEQDASNNVSVNWTAPSQTFGKTLGFDVLFKFETDETSGTFATVAGGLTTNSYTFAPGFFDNVGTYTIKVQITTPDVNFLPTTTQKEVTLTRLPAPEKLQKDGTNLTVCNNNVNYLNNISIVKTIDSVPQAKQLEQPLTFSIADLQDGQNLQLNIAFTNSFQMSGNQYYLPSAESTFNIYKFGTVQNLRSSKNNIHSEVKFNWQPAEENIDGIRYEYYNSLEGQTSVGGTHYQYASVPNSVIEEFDNYLKSNLSFNFYVKEVLNSDWEDISANETKYISSDTYASITFHKENKVYGTRADVVDDNIVLSWQYDGVEAFATDENYNPSFNIEIVRAGQDPTTPSVPTLTKVTSSAYGTNRTEPEGFYETTLSLATYFADAGGYSVSISVEAFPKTLGSDKTSLLFKKLTALNALHLENETATFMKFDNVAYEDIDFTGIAQIVVDGFEVTGAQIQDLSSISTTPSTITAYKRAVGLDAASGCFYLDSNPTTFLVQRLEARAPLIDTNVNSMTWSPTIEELSDITEYEISFAPQGQPAEVKTFVVSTPNIDLNDPPIDIGTIPAGVYEVTVRACVQPQNIEVAPQIGYISSFPSTTLEIEKLAAPENVRFENSGSDILLKWDEVAGAEYAVYIDNQVYPIERGGSTEWNCTNQFNGAARIWVVAKAHAKIPSEQSNVVTVLSAKALETLSISPEGWLTWEADTGIGDYANGGFVLDLLQNNTIKATYAPPTNTTSLNLFECAAFESFMSGEETNGKSFVAEIYIKGAISPDGTSLTLDGTKATLEVFKLQTPTVNVENNTISLTSANDQLLENFDPTDGKGLTVVQKIAIVATGTETEKVICGTVGVPATYTGPVSMDDHLDENFEVTTQACAPSNAPANVINSFSTTVSVSRLVLQPGYMPTIAYGEGSTPSEVLSGYQELNEHTQELVYVICPQVEGATEYELHIKGPNSMIFENVDTDWGVHSDSQKILFFKNQTSEQKELFAQPGTYEIKVRAKNNTGNLCSNFSPVLKVVRMALITAYIDADAKLHLDWPQYASNNYSLQIFLTDAQRITLFNDDAEFDMKTKGPDETVDLAQYINVHTDDNEITRGIASGEFNIGLRFIGTDVLGGDNNDTVILSTSQTIIKAYKLPRPYIQAGAANAVITNNDDSTFFTSFNNNSSSATVHDVAEIRTTVFQNIFGDIYTIAQDDNGENIENRTLENNFEGNPQLNYPDCWEAGDYELWAKSSPKSGQRNIVSSEFATKTLRRLYAPTRIGFKQPAIPEQDRSSYYSDDANFDDFCNAANTITISLEAPVSLNCLKFCSENVSRYEPFTLDMNNLSEQVLSQFSEWITDLRSSDEEGKFIAKVSVCGMPENDYEVNGVREIQSQKCYFEYQILKEVPIFYTNGEEFFWNSSESLDITGYQIQSSYLIENGNYWERAPRYWQTDHNQTSSTLADLRDSGNTCPLKIRALGNLTDEVRYDNIVLHSPYKNGGENIVFTKLLPITDLHTEKGLLAFSTESVLGANLESLPADFDTSTIKYELQIKDSNGVRLFADEKLFLENFKGHLKAAESDFATNYFVGYNNKLATLDPNQTYTLSVRAVVDLTEETLTTNKVLFASYCEPITFQVLPNANAGTMLGLTLPEGANLCQKVIEVNLATGADGLWICEDGQYYSVEHTAAGPYQYRPIVTQSNAKTLSFASFGSSIAAGAEETHYLTSAFSTITLEALEKANIRIQDGKIVWDAVTNADGYYVKINGAYVADNNNMAVYFTGRSLTLPEIGNSNGGGIKIEVIPVRLTNDILWGPTAQYDIVHVIENPQENIIRINNPAITLPAPGAIVVKDGAIQFEGGLSSIDAYIAGDVNGVFGRLNTLRTELGKTDLDIEAIISYINQLEDMIAEYLNGPIRIYSKYTGFQDPTLNLIITTQTDVSYDFTTNAHKLLKLTQSQMEKLIELSNEVYSAVNTWLLDAKWQDSSYPMLYTFGQEQTFTNATQYIVSRLQKIKENFDTISEPQTPLKTFLTNQITTPNFPSDRSLFSEIASGSTANFTYGGDYYLKIRQIGNNTDFLTSAFSASQIIYVPKAPTNLKIVEQNYNYSLTWDANTDVKVSPRAYEAMKDGTTTTDIVYALYGQTKLGEKTLICRTTGGNGQHTKTISLTNLIENGQLDSSICGLCLVVVGNYEGSTEETRIISGMTSNLVPVTILPEVTVQFENGELTTAGSSQPQAPQIPQQNPTVQSTEEEEPQGSEQTEQPVESGSFEIVYQNGYQNVVIYMEKGARWAGTDLAANGEYTIQVRYIGNKVTQQSNFVISGKKLSFQATKLRQTEVSPVAQDPYTHRQLFGVFGWTSMAGTNGSLLLNIDDSSEATILDNLECKNKYEAQITGLHTFNFRTLGTTNAQVVKDSEEMYYFSSSPTSVKAVMLGKLPGDVPIRIEDGLIKWNGFQSTSDITYGYKLTLSNGSVAYVENAYEYDYTEGTSGNHVVKIQTYAKTSSNQCSSIQIGADTYYELLGEVSECTYVQLAPPSAIKIEHGRFTWEGCGEGATYYYRLIQADNPNKIFSGTTTETSVWPKFDLEGKEYLFEVRARTANTLYSCYSPYINLDGGSVEQKYTVQKVAAPNSVSLGSEGSNNYIFVAKDNSALNLKVNLRYKIDQDDSYSYLMCYDENYGDYVTTENNKIKINISKLAGDKDATTLFYAVQLVPYGEASGTVQPKYLSSDFYPSGDNSYAPPDEPAFVEFDSTTKEFYFPAQSNTAYSIRDSIYDGGNLVAIYYYSISAKNNIQDEKYYKERLVNGTTMGTFSFKPAVMGYRHEVAVAQGTKDATSELISQYLACGTSYVADLFGVEFNLFSNLETVLTREAASKWLVEHAYGTSANPYQIANATQFANINFMLEKYSYMDSYKVDLIAKENLDIFGGLSISEGTQTQFVFKQTENLAGITTAIGLETWVLGAVDIDGFGNIYDGGGKSITYNLTPSSNNSERIALFRQIETTGIVKNLSVSGTIESIPTIMKIAGLAVENNGVIENITLSGLTITNLGVSSESYFEFGGIVSTNKGTIQDVLNNATIVVNGTNNTISKYAGNPSNNGTTYIGGVVAKNESTGTIMRAGNTSNIIVQSNYTLYFGGIVGYNNGNVTQCYNKGDLTAKAGISNIGGTFHVGGLVGFNDSNGSVSFSYVDANISAGDISNQTVYAGGIIGTTNNTAISNVCSFVEQIVVQTSGNTIGYTLVGQVGPNKTESYVNYYAYGPAVADSNSSFGILSLINNINSQQSITNLVANLNNAYGSNIFKNAPMSIAFVWE